MPYTTYCPAMKVCSTMANTFRHSLSNLGQDAGTTPQRAPWVWALNKAQPHRPQSNGEAERAFQTAKKLLKTEADLQVALLSNHATLLVNACSPAQLLYGHRI